MGKSNMTKYKAEQLLGLDQVYSVNDLNANYRQAVRDNHPDAGGDAEKMVEINAAKDYLSSFFADDKNARVEPSKSEFGEGGSGSSNVNVGAGTGAGAHASTTADSEVADVVEDMFRNAYATNNSDKDADFYTGGDYTKKSQDTWSAADWRAFMAFQPPIEWKDANFAVEKMKSNRPASNPISQAGNIDVSGWRDTDWYFYWFANARYPIADGRVYTRLRSKAYAGPQAERDWAKSQPWYHQKEMSYTSNVGKRANTKFGSVDCDSFENMGRAGNVGVPYAFALVEDYALWVKMNLEAEAEAKKTCYDRKLTKEPVGHEAGWSGREFLHAEDAGLFDSFAVSIDEVIARAGSGGGAGTGTANGTGAGADAGNTADVKAQTDSNTADSAGVVGSEDARKAWERRMAYARSAAYRNMGINGDSEDNRIGNGKGYYNRANVAGMPVWYKMLNTVLNHIPWRILAWITFGVVMACLYNGGNFDQMTFALAGVGGVILCAINQTGYFTNWVRGLLRGLLDGALKVWEKVRGKQINWIEARNV